MKKNIKTILITNDDGFNAAGLKVLKEIAKLFTYDVYVIAPKFNQSAKSRSITLNHEINFEKKSDYEWIVDGTPTDCVIFAINYLMKDLKPDLILTIADRFETLPIATAASYMNIPIAHTQGGEQTGSIDESVRHATTKLSQIHFPSTLKSKQNLIKMGENKKNVYLTGCPSLDLIPKKIAEIDKNFFKKYTHVGNLINYKEPYIVILQHPVTTEYKDAKSQISETIEAIKKIDLQVVWLWPNVDAGSDDISKAIRTFREDYNPKKIAFFKNFNPTDFIKLIYNSKCFVGNSSSAIREGSFLGIPAVNIGSRQANREKSSNIIDVHYDATKILKAIKFQINHGKYKKSLLYGNRDAGKKISNIIKNLKNITIQKKLNY